MKFQAFEQHITDIESDGRGSGRSTPTFSWGAVVQFSTITRRLP
ncbi:hypothetical protein NIES4106_27810 [Fischerella sp. NIES-4106]|jgi:hypothetical protein|nr:hypothetical protein NIES4106_27810 [Fischerella sp. NIES-4106]